MSDDTKEAEAQALLTQGLFQLLLNLEGDVRLLIGEVRNANAARAAADAQAARSHPLSDALVSLLREIGADPKARFLIAMGILALLVAVASWLVSGIQAEPGSLLYGILQVMDKHPLGGVP